MIIFYNLKKCLENLKNILNFGFYGINLVSYKLFINDTKNFHLSKDIFNINDTKNFHLSKDIFNYLKKVLMVLFTEVVCNSHILQVYIR